MSAIKRLFSSVLDPFINILVPPVCQVCGCTLAQSEEFICVECLARIPRTSLHLSDFNSIHQRVAGNHYINSATGWFYYYHESPYSRLIRSAKYDDMPALARFLGRAYARELADTDVLSDVDVLLPVPIHWRKRLQRGYNQTEEIARGISDITNIPIGDNLSALRSHSTQTARTGFERHFNVMNNYIAHHGNELDGLSITLVDDVITTGSTMLDCINAVCKISTPRKINILSIGVTHLR
jgi:ComF family protein